MFPDGIENFAQIDHADAIQLQSEKGRAACRRQADDEREVPIPGEMLVPILAARMKKRDVLFGQWINSFSLDVLMIVAALTGQRQIIDCCFAALFHRDDVFDGKETA